MLPPLYTNALKCSAAVALLELENLLCIYNCLISCYTPSIFKRGGDYIDRDSFEASLLEDGFSEEEAELIADDWIHQSENDD